MTRETPERRKGIITTAAKAVALQQGLINVTHEKVAAHCRIETSVWTVRRYFPTIDDLRTVAAFECRAQRQTDEMHCRHCGLRWPVEEEKPQTCRANQ